MLEKFGIGDVEENKDGEEKKVEGKQHEQDGKDEKDESESGVRARARVAGVLNARQQATEVAINNVFENIGPAGVEAVESFFFPRNASSFLTFSIQRLEHGAEMIEVAESQQRPALVEGEERKSVFKMQRYLTKLMEDNSVYGLTKTGPEQRRNHLKSRCAPLAHLWKTVVGSNEHFVLSNSQMQGSIRVEYGLPVAPARLLIKHCGLCEKKKDYALLAANPCHFLTCQKTRTTHVIRRHNEVCNVIARACRDLGHHTMVEPFKLDGVAIDSKRVDLDMMLGLQSVIADVTIRCSARKDVDKVLEAAEAQKTEKYREMAVRKAVQFQPLAFDAFGGFADKAQKFFKQMKQTGQPRDSDKTAAGIMRAMRQEISVAIHRYNGECLLAGLAASRKAAAPSM